MIDSVDKSRPRRRGRSGALPRSSRNVIDWQRPGRQRRSNHKINPKEQFKEKVDIIDNFCNSLKAFDTSLKAMDDWSMVATKELEDIKNSSDKMAPEDRVARTMDLQEDIAAKVEVIKKNAETELALLPQGEFCLQCSHH